MTGVGALEVPADAGRSERYMILRAVERVSPLALHGRAWCELGYDEQVELLAFADLRMREEGGGGS